MGTVVISADAELGWGFHDVASPPRARVGGARDGWRTLLALAEEYDLPLTWAVVGHLLLEDCDGDHDDVPAPPGWFDHERGPDEWPRSRRFGGELVEDVLSSPVDHEVACHSFSHVVFGAGSTDEELARAELRAFADAADRWGLSPTSFVFPRNVVGHRDVLAEFGYECYRGPSPFGATGSVLGRAKRTMVKADVIRDAAPVVEPAVDEFGLVNLPASMFLFDFDGVARTAVATVRGDPVVGRARRSVEAVAPREGLLHLWLHPNNVVAASSEARVESIFAHLDRTRERTPLTVETMGDVAREVTAREPAQ